MANAADDIPSLTAELRSVELSSAGGAKVGTGAFAGSGPSSHGDMSLALSSSDSPHISEAEGDFYKQVSKHLANEQQLVDNSYPRRGATPGIASVTYDKVFYKPFPVHKLGANEFRYTCERCKTPFTVNHSGPYQTGPCNYHYGRERPKRDHRGRKLYTCCPVGGTPPCTFAKCHVWDGRTPGLPQSGFVETKPRFSAGSAAVQAVDKVYSLDCETCYTPYGLELCKISVIDYNLKIVLDSYVKPSNTIVDYNTRFSGVTEKDLEGVTVTFEDIQRRLLSLISAETILIGHALENDMKTVKIIHSRIVDTTLVFPHKQGPPYKSSLKYLAQGHLARTIQWRSDGHDSSEDATVPMELMIKKVRNDKGRSSGRAAGYSSYY